jgi:hypothetical protein
MHVETTLLRLKTQRAARVRCFRFDSFSKTHPATPGSVRVPPALELRHHHPKKIRHKAEDEVSFLEF